MSSEIYECPRDLEQFGIRLLTGEACGLAMRGLFDLDKSGAAIVRSFLGVQELKENWNSGAVASVMLPYSVCEDLFIFAAMYSGRKYVFRGGPCHGDQWTETTYTGIADDGGDLTLRHPVKSWRADSYAIDDEDQMVYIRVAIDRGSFYITRSFTKTSHPGDGLNNTHQMSGRTP